MSKSFPQSAVEKYGLTKKKKMSFFADEKEPEMQIGYPTDVKHVAHIGWDGPSADSPSWVYCIHFPSFLPPQFIHCYEQNQFKVFATCPFRDSQSSELNRHEKHAVNPDVLSFVFHTIDSWEFSGYLTHNEWMPHFFNKNKSVFAMLH